MGAAPVRLVLAIWGASGVGKSVVSASLAARLAWPLRNCSKPVREAALALGVRTSALPIEEHLRVDEATREWVQGSSENVILEGRYLDVVLSPLLTPILGVELRCASSVREQRLQARSPSTTVEVADAEDAAHRRMLSSAVVDRLMPAMCLDTAALSIAAVSGIILALVEAAQRHDVA